MVLGSGKEVGTTLGIRFEVGKLVYRTSD